MGEVAKSTSRVKLEELSRYDTASFDQLYAIYASLFPLADEREPPRAFTEILDSNQNLAVQTAFGPYREIIAIARPWEGGPVVGGHIFGITTSAAHINAGISSSIQGIYTFLHEDFRGALPIHDIKEYSRKLALRTFSYGSTNRYAPPPIFFEANNPLKMRNDEIESDTQKSGLHPARRYLFWLRSGFRPLALPYVQPRLRPDAMPVRYLDLFCSNDAPSIPASVVLNHLRAFISVSVLKNRDAAEDEDFRAMEIYLKGRKDIELLQRDGVDLRMLMSPRTATYRGAEP